MLKVGDMNSRILEMLGVGFTFLLFLVFFVIFFIMALGHILGFFGISSRPNRFSIGDTLYEKISYITVTVVLIGLTYLMGRLLIGFLF